MLKSTFSSQEGANQASIKQTEKTTIRDWKAPEKKSFESKELEI
jgi:hypothetical protein